MKVTVSEDGVYGYAAPQEVISLLEALGYGRAVFISPGIYAVERMGLPVPGVAKKRLLFLAAA